MNPEAKTAIKSISKGQIKCIKAAQRRHLPDDEYYEILKSRFGVQSCTALTYAQASELIKLFKEWGFLNGVSFKPSEQTHERGKPDPGKRHKKREDGKIITIASFKEHQKINALVALIKWNLADGFTAWMQKKFGIGKVRTGHDAYLVIEGLKKVFENQMKKQHGPNWWALPFEDENIRRYIQYHCPEQYR